jgi:hypothetical protein
MSKVGRFIFVLSAALLFSAAAAFSAGGSRTRRAIVVAARPPSSSSSSSSVSSPGRSSSSSFALAAARDDDDDDDLGGASNVGDASLARNRRRIGGGDAPSLAARLLAGTVLSLALVLAPPPPPMMMMMIHGGGGGGSSSVANADEWGRETEAPTLFTGETVMICKKRGPLGACVETTVRTPQNDNDRALGYFKDPSAEVKKRQESSLRTLNEDSEGNALIQKLRKQSADNKEKNDDIVRARTLLNDQGASFGPFDRQVVILNTDGKTFTLLQNPQAMRLKKAGYIEDRKFVIQPSREIIDDALEGKNEFGDAIKGFFGGGGGGGDDVGQQARGEEIVVAGGTVASEESVVAAVADDAVVASPIDTAAVTSD